MNQLLLFIGVIVILYLFMSKNNLLGSIKKDNTTLLILLFSGVVLFMCMNKKNIEAFTLLDMNNTSECPADTLPIHICMKNTDLEAQCSKQGTGPDSGSGSDPAPGPAPGPAPDSAPDPNAGPAPDTPTTPDTVPNQGP